MARGALVALGKAQRAELENREQRKMKWVPAHLKPKEYLSYEPAQERQR